MTRNSVRELVHSAALGAARGLYVVASLLIAGPAHAAFTPSPLRQNLQYATDHNVLCDGVHDDSAALNAWFATMPSYSTVEFPGGSTCLLYASGITLPTANHMIWNFNGATIRYVGTNSTQNVITSGVAGGSGGGGASCAFSNWAIYDLTVETTVSMTGGDGFVMSDGCDVHVEHVVVGQGLNGNSNFYNGMHIAGGNTIYITHYSFRGSHAGELIHGDGAAGGNIQATDIFHSFGNIANGATGGVGLWIAGNCGGCQWDQTDVVGNYKNVLIDQSQVGIQNRQVRFGPGFASDGTKAGGIGVDLEDPGASGSQLFFEGSWISTASTICLNVGSAVTWEIHLIGVRMENCPTAGISNGSGNVRFIIDGGTIAQNGTGFYNNPSTNAPYVHWQARPTMYGNSVANETGLAPTIASGCGGTGATVTGDDEAFFVTWGATAGTACVLNWKTSHSSPAGTVSIMPQGVNVTTSLSASTVAQLGITTSANVSSGQGLMVGVGGDGF